MTSRVLLEVAGGIATITLNYPEAQNRFAESMREELLGCVVTASGATEVGCIVLTGAGENFCGGADVEEMLALHRSGDVDEIRRRVQLGGEVVDAIRKAPQPVVAAVNGLAAGAGVGLALACDIRLGSDRTRFAAGFVRLGLLPDWGGLDSVLRSAGHGGAADMLLSATPVDAERSLSLGLLQHVYPLHEFDAQVRSYSDRIARFPRAAVLAIKERLIAMSYRGQADSILDFELERQTLLFLENECGQALQSFVDRQKRNSAESGADTRF